MKQLESVQLYKSKAGNKITLVLWSIIILLTLILLLSLIFPLSHHPPQLEDGVLYLSHSKSTEFIVYSKTKVDVGEKVQLFQDGHYIAYGKVTKSNSSGSFIFFNRNSTFNTNYLRQNVDHDKPTKVTF